MNESDFLQWDDEPREGARYEAIRIDDIADWRLIAQISATGVGAWLKHDDPMRRVEKLFEVSWAADSEQTLKMIEDAIYDHPQVLDDFSSDIVVVAPKSIWVPTDLVADDDEKAAKLYCEIYNADEEEVMSETIDDITCLYTLVPGLKAFLQRTFSGSRIHSHLGVLVKRFRERSADVPNVFVNIRDREVDFIALDRKDLIMAATHYWYDKADIIYHLFNILNVFGLNPAEVQVSLSGPAKLKTELVQTLRKDIAYVMMTMLPTVGTTTDMPIEAALLLRNK